MYRTLACLMVTFLGFLPTSAGAEVIVTNSDHRANAYSSSIGNNLGSAGSTAIPWNHTITASVTDGSNAQNTVTRTPSAGGYQLQSNFSLFAVPINSSSHHSFAQAYGYEYFTTDAATPYSITGLLSTTDGGYYQEVRAWIYDLTIGQWVVDFYNYQFGANAALELGGPQGIGNTFGNLAGTLTAGHQYEFVYVGLVQNYGSYDTEANGLTGGGFVTLSLGAVVTPEPASLIVWGLFGSCAAVASYRRRKQFAA
jgi:hypothetical protein